MPERTRKGDAELHITVVTGAVEGRTSLDVAHETALVKAALLYADRVTLASPRVAMLSTVAALLNLSPADRGEATLQMVTALPQGAEVKARIDSLRRKKRRSLEERYAQRDLERQLRAAGDDLASTVGDLLTEAGVSEIAVAIEAGLLDLDPLGMDKDGNSKRVVEHLAGLLGSITAPGATTYPLLDQTAGDLLGAMVKEGLAPDADARRMLEPAVGTRWIGQMEAFPDVEMARVLELREALEDPLVRYRAAVIKVTRQFEATPLDDAFAHEAGQAYRLEVEPALAELRELAREKSVTSLLKHEASSGIGGKLGGALMGLVGATVAQFPQIVGSAAGLGVDTVASMKARRDALGSEQRQIGYFYLFESDRRMRK